MPLPHLFYASEMPGEQGAGSELLEVTSAEF